jgi:hypothetical protein
MTLTNPSVNAPKGRECPNDFHKSRGKDTSMETEDIWKVLLIVKKEKESKRSTISEAVVGNWATSNGHHSCSNFTFKFAGSWMLMLYFILCFVEADFPSTGKYLGTLPHIPTIETKCAPGWLRHTLGH